jgi:hypothetical protein
MSPRPIDLTRAGAGLARLDALLIAHPELREPDAQARLRVWLEEEPHRMMARPKRHARGDLKTRARVQRLREKRKQAGWQQAEVWFDPDTAALLTQLRQPGERLTNVLQRALQALAQQAEAPRPQAQGTRRTSRHASDGETPQDASRGPEAPAAALVGLLSVLLPAGERRYLRDCGIMTLPLAQLNAVLAPMGYVIHGTKTRSPDRFVLCTDAQGQVERYGLFELRRLEED